MVASLKELDVCTFEHVGCDHFAINTQRYLLRGPDNLANMSNWSQADPKQPTAFESITEHERKDQSYANLPKAMQMNHDMMHKSC